MFGSVYAEIENAGKPTPGTGQDVILWKHEDNEYKDHFSTTKTWNHIRARGKTFLGAIYSGSLKGFQDRPSLFGWRLKIDYLREFV